MKIILLFLAVALFSGCFWGSENYEKGVNAFFFLYSKSYEASNVCLGTIQYGESRLTDSYLCSINQIGWDDFFIIAQTRDGNYFIQDLRKLNVDAPTNYQDHLFGPMNFHTFNLIKDSLQVNKDLQFEVKY